MRARLARGLIAVVLLLAFVGDLRVLAPIVAVLLVIAAWRELLPRAPAVIGAVVLGTATVAFEAGNEVAAWTMVLTVAALAGVSVVSATGGSAAGRRAVGSSSRAG